MPTDITEDAIRELALPLGFVDVKVCVVKSFVDVAGLERASGTTLSHSAHEKHLIYWSVVLELLVIA